MGERETVRKPWDIGERTLAYAVRAIRLYRALEEAGDSAGRVIRKQYLRSATSIGANVAEAKSGESAADFVHKYSIAQKEARESAYWLLLMDESELLPRGKLESIRKETDELLAIITSIIVNTKAKRPRKT